MFKPALQNLLNKKGNITLTVVILISAILVTIGTGLILSSINSLNNNKSSNAYNIAKTRAESCIEESLSKIKNDNTFQNTLSLNFSDGSQCSSLVSNLPPGDTSNSVKNLKVAALYNGYNYEVQKTVNVLGSSTALSAITWQQQTTSDPLQENTDDKNSAYNLAYTSSGIAKGKVDSSGNYTTLLSYTNSSSSKIDYKISSTNMSSLVVSADLVNILDLNTRIGSLQYSDDNGNTFKSITGSTCTLPGSPPTTTTSPTCSFTGTGSSVANIAGTITFSKSLGAGLIIRLNLTGSAGGSEKVGWKTITFSPTANTFDFVPRTASLNIEGNIPPTAISTLNIGGISNPNSLVINGKYAYIGLGDSGAAPDGFRIYDISNPLSPVQVTTSIITTNHHPYDMKLKGNYLYITNAGSVVSANSLQIFDVSNPTSPIQVTSGLGVQTAGTYTDSIDIQGRYAYLTNFTNNTFQIFDISNPSLPVQVTSGNGVSTGTGPESIKVQGNFAYITNSGSSTFQVFDISNPANPVQKTTGTGLSTGAGTQPKEFYIEGKYAYISLSVIHSLQIFDISNPASPTALITGTGFDIGGTSSTSVNVKGKYVYIGRKGSTNNIVVLDISTKTAPILIGTIVAGNGIGSINIQGRYLYALNNNDLAFQIFDIGGAYIQQLEAGAVETSSIFNNGDLISNNALFNGSVNIGQSLLVNGNAAVSGILTSNKIGIGTATPAGALDIKQSNSIRAQLLITNTNSGASKSTEIALGVGGSVGGWFIGTDYAYNGSDDFYIYGGGTSFGSRKFVIGQNGIIGLGTGQPVLIYDAGNISTAVSGSAGNAALSLTGSTFTGGTGATNIPLFFIQPVIAGTSSSWSTSGTAIGVNLPTGFTGNFFDFKINGGSTSLAKLDSGGNLTVTSCNGCGITTLTTLGAATGAVAGLANGTNTIVWNWLGLTTTTAFTLGTDTTGLTTGSILAVGGGTTAFAQVGGTNTGSLVSLSAINSSAGGASAVDTANILDLFANVTSSAATGTSITTNGLNIRSTINTTGALAKTINGINIATPTNTVCTTGACTWTGLNIASPGTLANTTFVPINYANLFKVSSTGSLTFGTSGGTVDFASTTNGNTFIMKIPQKATTTTCASAAAEGLIFQTTGGTQVGHACINGPTAASNPNKLSFYALAFNAAATDLAENYSDKDNSLSAGDIVVLDPFMSKGVRKATVSGDNTLLGIISDSPGLKLSGIEENGKTDLVNPKAVALAGRVPVKVTTKNGIIRKGDFITSSNISGVGQKSTDRGFIVGKALDDYTESDTSKIGKILVFVGTIYYMPKTIASSDNTISYFDVSGNSLVTTFSINTKEGLTSKSLETGSIKALDIKSQCTDKDHNVLSDKTACSAFAQKYETTELTQAGDIVQLNILEPQKLEKTKSKASKLIVGIVTENAGVTLGLDGGIQTGGNLASEITDITTIVGFAGKTVVKVNNENGEIKIGDAITSSSDPGIGMKAGVNDPTIGIALENYSDKTSIGKILVLINKN